MSILKYLKSKDGLPDPKGPLCMEISVSVIRSANQEVRKEIESS